MNVLGISYIQFLLECTIFIYVYFFSFLIESMGVTLVNKII